MSQAGSRPPVALVVRLVAVGGTALIAARAVEVGLRAADANVWLVVLDVAVGVAFLAGAALAPGSWRMRAIAGAVGVAWLAGSIVPAALVAHQGVLIAAVVAFPAGRPHGPAGWVVLAAAAPVALGLLPQPVVALTFWAAMVASVVPRSSEWAYPGLTAGGVGLALGATWLVRSLDPFFFNPDVAEAAYHVILLLVAIGFPVAMGGVEVRNRIGRRVLGDKGMTGLAGLSAVLAEALRDPSIQVYRWDSTEQRYFDASDRPMARPLPMRWRKVSNGGVVLGAVTYRAASLDDERTAAAVVDALRLALQNLEGQRELERHLRDLEDARARLLATIDHERASVAAELRDIVIAPISAAAAALHEVDRRPATDDITSALAVALDELDGVSEELMQLIQGLGPGGLGNGGVASALRDVAVRSPFEVAVDAEPEAIGDAASEAVLYYACLEAMANAAKHASARSLRIIIRRRGDLLEAIIADDGIGGADPRGSGFVGLADRLAAVGGRLRVDSPPGAGTTVTATVPISRSSAIRSESGGTAPPGPPR